MIVSSAQLSDLWDVIRDEIAQSSEKSITVLHSISEVDSACAARLLMVRACDAPAGMRLASGALHAQRPRKP